MICTVLQKNIQGIKFILFTKDELIKTPDNSKDRFAKAITIPGTRSYHEFIPPSENTIAMKYCNKDTRSSYHFLLFK